MKLSKFSINEERVRELGEIIKEIGLKRILEIEKNDPQYKAIENLAKLLDTKSLCALTLMNALVSYNLTSKGENYWFEFSDYFSKRKIDSELVIEMINFLKTSKGNKLALNQKVSRLLRLKTSGFIQKLLKNFDDYSSDPLKLWRGIYLNVKSDKNSKTVVFSVKMFFYAYRASTGKLIIFPMNIPIPVDRRITKLTITSGIIDVKYNNLSIKHLMKTPEIVRKAWHMVSLTSKIPPLHIDSLIWPLGGLFVDYTQSNEKILERIRRFKGISLNIPQPLINKLTLQLLHNLR